MAKLYIANTTKQDHFFTYRLPGMAQVFPRTIKMGQQICIKDISNEEIEKIVKQHEIYGLRDCRQMSRLRGFVGISYNIDKPVPIDAMLATFESNDKTVDEEAQQRREATAAAMSESIGKKLAEVTGNQAPNPPTRLEVETTEETTGSPGVASGVEVVRDPGTIPLRRARNN